MSHTLVVVGGIGSKRAYLDVPKDEAVRRFLESTPAWRDEGRNIPVEEFQFEDEFGVYEVWGP